MVAPRGQCAAWASARAWTTEGTAYAALRFRALLLPPSRASARRMETETNDTPLRHVDM